MLPFRRRCKVCILPPDLDGYDEVREAIREAARQGGSILGLYKGLKERFFGLWPPSRQFSYDSLHTHLTKHMGLDDFPARLEVRREAERWRADLEALRAEHADGTALLQDLARIAVDQMARGAIKLTGRDVVALFDLLNRIEEKRATKRADADLAKDHRRAVELLADAVGKLSTERLRLEIREEVRQREAKGQRPATIVRAALLRWNDSPPAEFELTDDLSVVS